VSCGLSLSCFSQKHFSIVTGGHRLGLFLKTLRFARHAFIEGCLMHNAWSPLETRLGSRCGWFTCNNGEGQRDVACAHTSTGCNDKVFEGAIFRSSMLKPCGKAVRECYGTIKSYYQALLGPEAV
jgi:hypothetical protein